MQIVGSYCSDDWAESWLADATSEECPTIKSHWEGMYRDSDFDSDLAVPSGSRLAAAPANSWLHTYTNLATAYDIEHAREYLQPLP
jgi:hypothetical protein